MATLDIASTSNVVALAAPAAPTAPATTTTEPRRLKPLTKAQRDFISAALRVNQAGELAATLIYEAQTPVITARHPHLRPLMASMLAQEAGHLRTFNELLRLHHIQPTVLEPAWRVLSTGLGWATAVMGREAAMACTEAVETEIGSHYNDQIRKLLQIINGWKAEGYDAGEELPALLGMLRRIRDEELEHLDHAVENDAPKAPAHWILTNVIRAGCKGAIWLSQKM